MAKRGDKTIVANIMRTEDPETGTRLNETDIIANANAFMYSPDEHPSQ
jgi:hypothetical protein